MIIKKSNGEEISMWDYLKDFKNEIRSQPVNKITEKKVFIPMSQLINIQTNKIVFIDGFVLKKYC
jgi:hypothetical protein